MWVRALLFSFCAIGARGGYWPTFQDSFSSLLPQFFSWVPPPPPPPPPPPRLVEIEANCSYNFGCIELRLRGFPGNGRSSELEPEKREMALGQFASKKTIKEHERTPPPFLSSKKP